MNAWTLSVHFIAQWVRVLEFDCEWRSAESGAANKTGISADYDEENSQNSMNFRFKQVL